MSKSEVNNTDDMALSKKLIDLFIINEIEESKMFIDMINNQIRFHNQLKKHLLDNPPLRFFKKQTEKNNNELKKIDAEIFKCYRDIEEELYIIQKLYNSISHNDELVLNKIKQEIYNHNQKNNLKISFYDLLTLLKNKNHPKKLTLEMCKKKEIYIFDDEGNYVLENEKAKNDIFEYYLSDLISDISKLEKNITILN